MGLMEVAKRFGLSLQLFSLGLEEQLGISKRSNGRMTDASTHNHRLESEATTINQPTMATNRIKKVAALMILCSSPMTLVSSFSARAVKRGRTASAFPLTTCRMSSTAPAASPSDSNPKTNTHWQQASPKTTTNAPFRINSNTGGLRKLPVVKRPGELLATATREIRRIRPDTNMGNIRNRARKHGAQTLNQLIDSLCLPLRDTVQGYQAEWKRLHPFERVVADLTARARQKKDGLTLNLVLEEIHEARKLIREGGKDWIAKVKDSPTAKEASETAREGVDAVMALFEEFASAPVDNLVDLQRGLRSAPTVALDTPAVVLVGSPNVGKSSIVRRVSSGTPEVNNYPFTTRGMTLGHIEVFWQDNESVAKAVIPDSNQKNKRKRQVSDDVLLGKYAFSQLCQVMDSPGLLARPDEKRNEMEALTMAAMQHLPTAVMFVLDLTGEAGDKCSSIEDQLELRREIRKRFPRRPWLDVVSKVDLGIVDGALPQLQEIAGGDSYIELSVHDGTGVEELKARVLKMLGEVRVVLDAMTAVDTSTIRPLTSGV